MGNLLEICCGSTEDVIAAEAGGADRVELNCALNLGGITPSIGEVKLAKAKTKIPVVAMIRPRTGGFCYTNAEFETMLIDTKELCLAGADGIATGILNMDGTVDIKRNAQIIEVIKTVEVQQNRHIDKVFHRAIDVTPDWRSALDAIIDLGFDRVLTSGQHKTAVEGAEILQQMLDYADGKIQILPGSGLNAGNITEFVKAVPAGQYHMTAGEVQEDTSCCNAPFETIPFNATTNSEDSFKLTNSDLVRQIKAKL